MAQPQKYEREVDFTERDGDDTNHAAVNNEFDAAALSINQIRDNLALIQRDDGALKNGIVTAESLAPSAFDAVLVEVNVAVGEAQTAAASANNAALSANTARDIAVDSASAAETSESNAAASAANAATAAQTLFNGLYLGAQSTDPALDLNGQPLNDGDFYYNTTSKLFRAYDASIPGFTNATPSGQFKRPKFVAGTDFTPGVTTALTLASDPITSKNVFVFFDGITQHNDHFSVSGMTLTFISPIPVGVAAVEVAYLETLGQFVPADESVTDVKVKDNAGIQATKLAAQDGVSGTLWTTVQGFITWMKGRWDALTGSTGSSLVGFQQLGAGSVPTTVDAVLQEAVSFKRFGAVGDGVFNDSDEINNAVAAHTHVKGTRGNYLYTATTTADPTRISLDPDAQIKGMKNQTANIGARDKSGDFIGFHHNYNETRNDNIAQPITTGKFVSPPLSDAAPVPGVDVMAYWYNDFGLEAVRAAGGAIGSTQWYTWQWAHTVDGAAAYDPNIHPLLGWYRGDDPVVLDWICYWLREGGVKGILQLSRGSLQDTSNWSDPTQQNHWLYQLFNNAPNFKGLSYVPDMGSGGTLANNTALINNLQTNILPVYTNYHVTNIDGKNYGTIWSYDLAVLRAGTYVTNTAFETMLESWATFFKGRGLDGVCVLARNGGFYTANTATAKENKDRVAKLGVQVFEVDYGNFSGVTAGTNTYPTLVNDFPAGYQAVKYSRVPNVMTARQSHGLFHPSGWVNTGTTPELFGKAAQQAAQMAVSNSTIPNIVTVYNVSEWGEGGPSLQPTVGRGFGYLDAIRRISVPVSNKGAVITDRFRGESATKIGLATDAVAFIPFTYTVTSSQSVSLVELTLVAKENTGNFANVANKYVFTLRNTSGTLVASAVTTDYTLSNSNTNYSITAAVAVTIVNATTATVSITLTKGGAVGWNNCEYVVKTNIISTDPASVV